jgi:general stress protein CsbA
MDATLSKANRSTQFDIIKVYFRSYYIITVNVFSFSDQ